MTTRIPVRRPSATWPAILIALSLVALAVVGLRELAVSLGGAEGESWADLVVRVAVTDPKAGEQVQQTIAQSVGGFLPQPAKVNVREVTR